MSGRSLVVVAWLGALPWSAFSGSLPPPRPWSEYQVIMWVGDSATREPAKFPLFVQRLREMGVTAGMAYGAGADPRLWLANRFPYYVENIVNKGLCLKWNSHVQDWDKFITGWGKTRGADALTRDFCLDDPAWRAWAADQMRSTARQHAPHQPLAYDIRDELSATVSANPFDYDFSPPALAGLRAWLKTVYADLAALNRQWETSFAAWEEVAPFTTDQIKHRLASGQALPRGQPDWPAVQRVRFQPASARQNLTAWNFSPWADFRTYMDASLAGALDELRRAARAADPATPVGIEGTQMPHAFGGYDLHRLALALDWVEPYDLGNAREIFGAFMPGKTILTTVFEKETNAARRRLWHLLLEGDRGCIVWWSEDCVDWADPSRPLNAKARALAPVFKELTSPLARLFLRAERLTDPVAVLYSQPSIQVDWLLESCPDGSTWLRRFSSFEAEHNRLARARDAWLKAFQDLGWTPRFISRVELLEPGFARRYAVLVLPTCLALAGDEAQAIRQFLAAGSSATPHAVFADGAPGLFDAHGRLRSVGPLDDLFSPATPEEAAYAVRAPAGPAGEGVRKGEIAEYRSRRLAAAPQLAWAEWVASQLRGMTPEVSLPVEARVRIHRYTLGKARLIALERNLSYQMSEDLKQAGGNQNLETPLRLTAKLARPAHAYDLRTRAYLGLTDVLTLTLDPWQPSLFALLDRPTPPETLWEDLLTPSPHP